MVEKLSDGFYLITRLSLLKKAIAFLQKNFSWNRTLMFYMSLARKPQSSGFTTELAAPSVSILAGMPNCGRETLRSRSATLERFLFFGRAILRRV